MVKINKLMGELIIKFVNIIIILIFLTFIIGSVSAVNPDDFKIPDGFVNVEYEFEHNHSEGFMNSKGEGIIIYDYSSEDKDFFFTESDSYVFDLYKNNIYTFADGESELCGYLEHIKHNGKEYVVQTTCSMDKVDSVGNDIRDNILEFNKINNVKPIPV